MIVVAFLVTDKANQVKFFEKTFLVANVSPEVIFEMLFLNLSGADVDFLDQKLWWKIYITEEALPTTRRIELMGEKEFAAATLDLEYETHIVYIGLVSSIVLLNSSLLELNIYFFYKPQISGLIVKKAPTNVPNKHINFADVFSLD